jgi:hypothetical protein
MQMEWLQDDLAEVAPVGEKWPKMFKQGMTLPWIFVPFRSR